jgi:hypothetical protein
MVYALKKDPRDHKSDESDDTRKSLKSHQSDEVKFIRHLEPAMRKRANRYQGSVGEDVFGDLVIFALSEFRKIKADKPEASGLDIAKMVASGHQMIPRQGKPPMKYYDLDKNATRSANKARGIQRNKAWKKGVKPQYPHAVLHQGTAYQLKPEEVDALRKNDPRLQEQPNTPEGQEIWEQIDRETYKALTNPIAGAASMDKTMGADSGTIGDTIASDDLGAEQDISNEEANEKQAKLTLADVIQKLDSMNDWAKEVKGYSPLSETEMKELKLRLAKPDITGKEIIAAIPELELIQKGQPAGRPKPRTYEQVKKKLSQIISHDDWADLREDIKGLSNLRAGETYAGKQEDADIVASV